MKKKLSGLAAACMLAAAFCGTLTAEAAPARTMRNDYADWRRSMLTDEGMLQNGIREMYYQTSDYFFSTIYPLSSVNAWYDSGIYTGEGAGLELYANILDSRSAVFYTKSPADAEAAEVILQAFCPDDSAALYERHDSCFYLTECESAVLDAIRTALDDAGLLACFYRNVPVYVHRKVFLPYLTGYSENQTHNPEAVRRISAEELQAYIKRSGLRCRVLTEESQFGSKFYVVPIEYTDLREHWALALRLYHDLDIVPEMWDDSASQESFNPPKGVGTPYDINADAVFDREDAASLAGYLLYEGACEDMQAGDMNADGRFSAVDLTLMKRALLAKNQPAEKELIEPPVRVLNPTLPSVGTSRIPVFAVSFPECDYSEFDIASILRRRLFSPQDANNAEYPFESAAAYFERASYGSMHLTGDVFRYAAAHPIDWYAGDYAELLVSEILESFDPGVDFRDYDADQNGILDSVILTLPDDALKIDRDGDKKPDWWPFSTDALSRAAYDGERVGKYCVIPYDQRDPADYVSKTAHELGHAMGLPDYYQYATETAGDEEGLAGDAGTELMDDGKGDLSAFSKLMLGWYAADDIQVYTGGTQTFFLETSQDVPSCIMIPRDPDAGLLSEYFLIEYMVPDGNQPVYGGSGIRILHVQAEVSEGDAGPELTYSNYGRHYDKSHQKQRVLRLVNGYGSFYPGKKGAQYQDTIDSDTAGFRWYDTDGCLTLDTGLTVTIRALHTGPFCNPASADRSAWISGFAEITVSDAAGKSIAG